MTENIHIHTEHDYGPNGQRGDPKYVVQQAITVTLQQASGDDVADAIDRMVNAAGNALQLNSVTVRWHPDFIHLLLFTTLTPHTVWSVTRGPGTADRHSTQDGG